MYSWFNEGRMMNLNTPFDSFLAQGNSIQKELYYRIIWLEAMSEKRVSTLVDTLFCIEWLPGLDTQRTNCAKIISEIIPCYYRYVSRKKVLCRGEKSERVYSKKPITQREWKSASKKNRCKNPIKEGEIYLKYLNSNSGYKYRDVAEKFGVSKARASQMIALVKKLPKEIIDYFYLEDNSANLRNFTERKLRPLTLLDSDDAKIDMFRELVSRVSSMFY